MSADTLEMLGQALLETIYMVGLSALFSVIIGSILAVIMIVTAPDGLHPVRWVYKVLDVLVNILRSFPFVILIVVLVPATRAIVGTSVGTTASIVPLTIAAAPFVTKAIEGSLREVNPGVIEAAKSFGASDAQIIFRVMIKEAMPSIMSGIILTIINLVGYSAMAGAIGGGGLGYVAISYGYERFETDITVYTVIILIIFVQLVQGFGDLIYKKLSK